ncbi:MAG: KpsF/GutQ family sugar-phosphate isomerase [Candidatus Nitronauta litoralis]|uniref:KpsF/GutQ family sugar-phosphate isomerase n=1 Tax=Candidatus Nitronauta litoralis TaxID=2705533 RepID=A0A7T0BZ58_9BACT|nr:MAG: KpsF/GutQ family sugar-phosphate isomerase [Candidatus Nitronauta litoralis]
MTQTAKKIQQDSPDFKLLEAGRKALEIESQALDDMRKRLDSSFISLVNHLDQLVSQSRNLVITGIGKSGLVGTKIAATFSSIGLPTIFLHAAEASHGDLGVLKQNDTLLMISNSGETEELLKLLPAINRRKCTLIAMTGAPESTLGRRAQLVLDVSVQEEACSLNLVPTASTTATMAMGDALAMALLAKRGFRPEDFAQFHPGGSLGRKLLTTVEDLMHSGNEIPTVPADAGFFCVLDEMSSKRLGATLVTDTNRQILGIITDGDIRRLIEKKTDTTQLKASGFMKPSPRHIDKNELAAKALQKMEEHQITSLVVSPDGINLDGFLHLHDLLKAGL